MLISEALDLKNKAFISLIGAGGKSTLFLLLARELSIQKKRVILTTTTHMFARQVTPFLKTGVLIESDNKKIMEERIKQSFQQDKNRTIILIHHRLMEQEEKIAGPEPCCLDFWWKEELADYFIVEADGARGKSIKGPAFYEPVIPEMTTDLIGVVGVDAVGLTLKEENVFRAHIFSRLTGLEWGEAITVDAIASLVNHPQGLFKNAPYLAEKYLFINKADNKLEKRIAEKLVTEVLKNNQAKISDIIIGNTFQEDHPVYKVIKGITE